VRAFVLGRKALGFAKDTSLEAARVYFAVWRRLGTPGRARQLRELNDTVRNLAAAGLRSRHPEYTEDQVRRFVARRLLGEAYFRAAAGRTEGPHMNQEEFIIRVVGDLRATGIAYMVAGSVGSGLHGEPRSTHDVDIVIDPTAEQLERLVQALGADYYVSPEAAREALHHRSMFNLIDFANGWKADLILRKDRPFSREEFSRRRETPYGSGSLWVASPEDVILSKLEWAKITPSERQLRDALGVAVTQWPHLDQEYLRHWARELGVEEPLELLLREARELQPPE
jgi:hypothetical protein